MTNISQSKWSSMTTIIALLIGMVGLQMVNMGLSVTNSVHGADREQRLVKGEDNYLPKKDALWFFRTYDEEHRSMMLFAIRDSASAIKAYELYHGLRNELFEIKLEESRGIKIDNVPDTFKGSSK